jgi:hypothetical protein
MVLDVPLSEQLEYYIGEFSFSALDFEFVLGYLQDAPWWLKVAAPETNLPSYGDWIERISEIPQQMDGLDKLDFSSQIFLFNYYITFRIVSIIFLF